MTTPRKPWPVEWSAQYHDMLAASRRISILATGIIEYCMPMHDVYRLQLYLSRINTKGMEIRNRLSTIYRGRRHTPEESQPQWAIKALEWAGLYSGMIVEQSAAALEHLAADNWKAMEIETDRCWAMGLLIEHYLLVGPPPEMDSKDVLDQVREIIETLED